MNIQAIVVIVFICGIGPAVGCGAAVVLGRLLKRAGETLTEVR